MNIKIKFLVSELTTSPSSIKTLEPIKDDLNFDEIHQEIGKKLRKQDEPGTDKILTMI